MKKNTFQLVLVCLLIGIGVSACSSSSNTPDFRGVYNTTLEIPLFEVGYKATLAFTPSETTKDIYQMDAHLVILRKEDKSVVLEKVPVVIANKNATSDSFTFKAAKKNFDFQLFGIGDLNVVGTVDKDILKADVFCDFTHKPEVVKGKIEGYKTGIKESTVARLNEVSCESGMVVNITTDHEKGQVIVFLNRVITENQQKELRLKIIPAEEGTYQVNTEVLSKEEPMIITVQSQDRKNKKTYQVQVAYVDVK